MPRLHALSAKFSESIAEANATVFFIVLHCKRLGLARGRRQHEPQVGDVEFQLRVQLVQLVRLLHVQTQHIALSDFFFYHFFFLSGIIDRSTWNAVTIRANTERELRGMPTEKECSNGSGLIFLFISCERLWPSFASCHVWRILQNHC